MEDLADPTLLASWCAGDQEAFAALVVRYHGLVRAACARQAAPGDIDDCVQAVFLVLSRRPAAAARVQSLAAWLQRVASFVCRHAKRSAERRRRAEHMAGQAPVANEIPASEALDHLDDCLLKLPANQRTAVVMHYLAGQSPEEVAAVLGTSRNNAYQLIGRGLTRLRQLLNRRGVGIGAASFASLLASEACAATVPVPDFIAVSLVTPLPSAKAAAYASGAINSMTITAIAPYALAICLSLATATMTAILAADLPLGPTTIAAHADPLDLKISLNLVDSSFANAIASIQRQVPNAKLAVDPEAAKLAPTLTFQVEKMVARKALGMMESLNGLSHEMRNGVYTIIKSK